MTSPFRRSTARWLVAVTGLSMLASGLLAVYGADLFETRSAGADAFSRSALGHRAALQVLHDLGWRVVISQHATSSRASADAVVLVAEPGLGEDGPRQAALRAILDEAPAVLLVLPKRSGTPEPARGDWLSAVQLRPLDEVQRALRMVDPGGQVVRPSAAGVGTWHGALPAPSLDAPQLMNTSALVPLLATEAGILVAEGHPEGRHLVVLSDPDVLENHGLGRGDDALLWVRILERLGAGPRAILVDETVHGHEVQPSLVRELLRVPLCFATFEFLFTGLLLAWAALVRFGRPRSPPPLQATGAMTLVESAGALLAHAGHPGVAVSSYFRSAQEQLAHDLRPPGERGGIEIWVHRHAEARGRALELAGLVARVKSLEGRASAQEALRLAADIHKWREEMSDGRSRDS